MSRMMVSKADWIREADQYMQREYGLPVDHGCFTEDEFYSRFGDEGQKSPQDAVHSFAEKYDLFSSSDGRI